MHVLGACALLACAVCTYRQTKYWKDTVTLAQHAVDVNGDNDFVCTILGIGYANERDYPQALDALQRAVRLRPNTVLALTMTDMGNVYVRMRDWDHARECFEEVQRYQPDDPANNRALGDYYFVRGQLEDAARAYQKSLRTESDQPQVQGNLALVYIRQQKFPLAIELLQQIEKTSAKDPEWQFHLGVSLAQQGKLSEAAEHLLRSLSLNAAAPQVHYELARVRLRQKKIEDTAKQLTEAVRLDPNYLAATQDLAWILATDPDDARRDPSRSLQLAQRANQLSGQAVPDVLDTLAASYAAVGDCPKAVDVAEKAVDLAEKSGKTELAQEIKGRLALYRAGQPFRDVSLAGH